MLGFLFAFLTAFFDSMKEVFSKKGLRHIDEYTVAWSLRFFATLFSIPLLFFIDIPSIGERFWEALILGGGLNVITTILYMKAYKHSDISITSPIAMFTPLFLLVTSPIMLGEFPTVIGLAGVLLIVAGSYVLNFKESQNGIFHPFKVLFRERGPRLMLAVAFIWSITSNFDKIGVKNSSPIFWVFAVNLFLSTVLFPEMLYKSKESIRHVRKNLKALVPIGLFSTVTLVFQMMAINLILVVYVTSIKRISSLLSVLSGHFVFGEKGIRERLAGAILMVLGVLLIALS